MKKLLFAVVAISFTIVGGCRTNSSTAGGEELNDTLSARTSLLEKLNLIKTNKQVAIGHHDDPVYGHSWKYEADSSDVKSVTGEYPALFSWDLGMIEMNSDRNLDGVPFEEIRKYAAAQDEAGGFNTFSWHVRNPATGGDAWDVSDTTVLTQILAPGALNDTIRQWIGRAADFIGSIKNSKGEAVPVIFRPWHEHTGSWFWWGKRLSSPEEYKALWHLTREVFDEKGVDNVVWAYSPGTEPQNVAEYLDRYPGDDYIDIVGGDTYDHPGPDGKSTYAPKMDKMLAIADSVATSHNKILALTETGFEGIKDPEYFTEALMPVLGKYPVTYVVFWRNAHDKDTHYYVPYPGHPAAPDFVDFFNLPATLFQGDMNKPINP